MGNCYNKEKLKENPSATHRHEKDEEESTDTAESNRQDKDHRNAPSFDVWKKTVNGGSKTTLEQEFQLAFDLYQRAYPQHEETISVKQVIDLVKETKVQDMDGLVSWTGIQVGWFLEVLCESPFFKTLMEYGCESWFIRKVCVIEMIRRTMATTRTTTTTDPT